VFKGLIFIAFKPVANAMCFAMGISP